MSAEPTRAEIDYILRLDRRRRLLTGVAIDIASAVGALLLLGWAGLGGVESRLVWGLAVLLLVRSCRVLISNLLSSTFWGRMRVLSRVKRISQTAARANPERAVNILIPMALSNRRYDACIALRALGPLAGDGRVGTIVVEVIAGELHSKDGFVRQSAAEAMSLEWRHYGDYVTSLGIAEAMYADEGAGQIASAMLDRLQPARSIVAGSVVPFVPARRVASSVVSPKSNLGRRVAAFSD